MIIMFWNFFGDNDFLGISCWLAQFCCVYIYNVQENTQNISKHTMK